MTGRLILLQRAMRGAYQVLAALYELATGDKPPKLRELMTLRE